MLDKHLSISPAAKTPGLLVVSIDQRGLAILGGLEKDDVITNVNNQPIRTMATFKELIEKLLDKNVEDITLLVRRGNETKSIKIELSKKQ